MYEGNIFALISIYMEQVEEEKEKKKKDAELLKATELMQGALAIQVKKTKEQMERKKEEDKKEKILGKLVLK